MKRLFHKSFIARNKRSPRSQFPPSPDHKTKKDSNYVQKSFLCIQRRSSRPSLGPQNKLEHFLVLYIIFLRQNVLAYWDYDRSYDGNSVIVLATDWGGTEEPGTWKFSACAKKSCGDRVFRSIFSFLLLKDWSPRSLIHLFKSFLDTTKYNYYEKFSCQRESNLDRRSRNPERWPVNHHHGPFKWLSPRPWWWCCGQCPFLLLQRSQFDPNWLLNIFRYFYCEKIRK